MTPFLEGDVDLNVIGFGLAVIKNGGMVYIGLQLGPFAIYLGVQWDEKEVH